MDHRLKNYFCISGPGTEILHLEESSTRFFLFCNNAFSNHGTVSHGVPHGSVFGPFPFSLYLVLEGQGQLPLGRAFNKSQYSSGILTSSCNTSLLEVIHQQKSRWLLLKPNLLFLDYLSLLCWWCANIYSSVYRKKFMLGVFLMLSPSPSVTCLCFPCLFPDWAGLFPSSLPLCDLHLELISS